MENSDNKVNLLHLLGLYLVGKKLTGGARKLPWIWALAPFWVPFVAVALFALVTYFYCLIAYTPKPVTPERFTYDYTAPRGVKIWETNSQGQRIYHPEME